MRIDKLTSVQLGSCLSEISRREMVEDGKSYKILGVKWYANGAWVKDEKKGDEIKAKYLYKVNSRDLIYNRLFAWKGAFAIIPENLNNCYISNEFPVFKVKDNSVNINFIFLYLSKPSLWDQIERQSSGVSSISRKRFKASDFLKLEIYLPEIKRQNSIINGYRKIEKHQENIQRLQNDNSSMCVKLRQAILQLAVQGKLVPQDSKDEPASILLEKIKAEKERLIKEGKIKKPKPLPPINPDEISYELPNGWEWVRLGTLCETITKGSSPKWQGVNYVDSSDGILFITSQNVGNYYLKLDKAKYVEVKFNKIEPRSILKRNDILMNIVGASIGRTAFFDLEEVANINQAVCLIRMLNPNRFFEMKYFLYFFNSPVCIGYMFDKQVDNARPNLSMTNISQFAIPFPSKNEQKRIVAKVDQLMVLCDELETSLSQSQTDCDRLMEAVVAKILAA